jgi:hypothetical protein
LNDGTERVVVDVSGDGYAVLRDLADTEITGAEPADGLNVIGHI